MHFGMQLSKSPLPNPLPWKWARGLFVIISCLFAASQLSAKVSPEYVLKTLQRGQPVAEADVDAASAADTKNATYIQMLEAFAVLRKGDLNNPAQVHLAKTYLERAQSSFDDLRDADNFSVAFSKDADTIYRGRPYERVMTAMMLALIDMSQDRCDLAMPALRNAEFLDARWRAMPFGSDAPMVYALMLRCANQMQSSATDTNRAREGLHRSLRLILANEPLNKAFKQTLKVQLRPDSLAVRFAQILFELGISSALMTSTKDLTPEQLLNNAAGDASKFLNEINTKFADQYKDILQPMAQEIAKVEGDSSAKSVEDFAFTVTGNELRRMASETIQLLNKDKSLAKAVNDGLARAHQVAKSIERAVRQPRLALRFSGQGPRVIREGQYQEVARIVPTADGSAASEIRQKLMDVQGRCGLQRDAGGALLVVLCDENAHQQSINGYFDAIELWSSSLKATSMMGRRFDKILQGRAEFKQGAENIAVVSGATALALLAASSDSYNQCVRRGGTNCSEASAALAGAGAVAGAIAGIAYIAGKASNPAADPRFVSNMFESGYVLVAE